MSVFHTARFKEFGSSMCLWQALNFEKCNLRSGHLMWPGGVTFGVSGSSFFGNVSNSWLNSYGKFSGATRRRFFAICEKPEGAAIRPSPAVRGMKCRHHRRWVRAAQHYVYQKHIPVQNMLPFFSRKVSDLYVSPSASYSMLVRCFVCEGECIRALSTAYQLPAAHFLMQTGTWISGEVAWQSSRQGWSSM